MATTPATSTDTSLTAKERCDLAIEVLKIAHQQDDLVHSWTRTLMATQGAEAIAIAVVWTNLPDPSLRAIVVSTIALIGIVTCWVCVSVAISDLRWQGKYVGYVKALDPTQILFEGHTTNESNLGVQALWFRRLAFALTGAWSIAIAIAICARLA